ncbi:MAG: low molecular weight phosphotyrosine protein phosphatase [Burkholderiales bacterium]|uniref:low molecular weight protein-tyrosine-phosphatase n=1 Tax=Inhella sp. TaxID=1921806 RepID=UPI001AC21D26|nr:low molecular weight phosphotyrosine protein phosphatase [Burkholderiales bacterium]
MKSLLLVCRANLCRSPMAEAVFRAVAPALGLDRVASAGISAAPRGGEAMDPRARAALERRQYTVDKKWRSRRVVPEDLAKFHLILAMDGYVLEELREMWPGVPKHRVHLLLDHLPGMEGEDVPDPYYSSAIGFDVALDLIETAVANFKP